MGVVACWSAQGSVYEQTIGTKQNFTTAKSGAHGRLQVSVEFDDERCLGRRQP